MGKFSDRNIVVTFVSKGVTKVIKDLHIDVMTRNTLAGVPNSLEMNIFNLKKESREFLSSIYDNNGKSEMTVEVTLNDVKLYKGDVVNIDNVHIIKDATWASSIYANEGWNIYQKTINAEVPKGSSRNDAINTIMDSLKEFGISNLDLGAMKERCGDKSLLKRLFVSGNVMDNLKKLVNDCLPDADVVVEGDTVAIIGKDKTRDLPIPVLSEFLEVPSLTESGMTCTISLDTDVKIGGLVTLKAKSFKSAFGNLTTNRVQKNRISGEGTYKVLEAVHTVDNYTDAIAKTDITGIFI